MTTRILIADDHKVVCQGLRMYLDLDPELEVVGEAYNGEQALRMARRLEPDVVLMDLLMPVMDGIEETGDKPRREPRGRKRTRRRNPDAGADPFIVAV